VFRKRLQTRQAESVNPLSPSEPPVVAQSPDRATTGTGSPGWKRSLNAAGSYLSVLAAAGTATWLILAAAQHRWPFAAPGPPSREFRPERYTVFSTPLTVFPIVPADEVKDALDPAELVLGVTIGGESRAYPLNALNAAPRRKAVNDTLGGQAIVATWCDACHSGIVYERVVEGRTLTLAASGQLWMDSMVLYDRETRTFWSQLGGEAKDGPLKGTQLHKVPSIVTDWESWRRLYPKSTVLLLPFAHREFRRDFYRHPENYVLGIADGGHAKAWGLDVLRQSAVLNEEWNGRPVLVVFDPASATAALYERLLAEEVLTFRLAGDKVVDEQSGSSWNCVTGEAESGPLRSRCLRRLPAVLATRTAWNAFHP
jgi:hypothetical protein